MDYLKEAENELKDYGDLLSALEVLQDEIKIVNYELLTVKSISYDTIPGGNSVNGDDRLVNLTFKKQVKVESYKITRQSKVL